MAGAGTLRGRRLEQLTDNKKGRWGRLNVQITKFSTAPGAIDYYLNRIEEVLYDNTDPTDYYVKHGNPAGVWTGRGCAAHGVNAGTVATPEQARRLMSMLRNPIDDKQLQPGRIRIYDDEGRLLPPDQIRSAVGFWDLTFDESKSVSILFALGDDRIRNTVLECHREAIEDTIRWFEDHVARTRSGRAGAVQEGVEGVTAIRFQHFESRDHDPHLHTHVTVSNLVRRSDGNWRTLDGRAMLTWTVAMSERYNNLSRDLLRQRLGVEFTERATRTEGSKARVMEIAGIPDELIELYSKRNAAIDKRANELIREFHNKRGVMPDHRQMAAIRNQAWAETRQRKDETVRPLEDMLEQWKRESHDHGWDPHRVVSAVIDRAPAVGLDPAVAAADQAGMDALTRLLWEQMREDAKAHNLPEPPQPTEHDVIEQVRREVTGNDTTFTAARVMATAERLTAGIRFDAPGARDQLVKTLTQRVLDTCIPVNPVRYKIDPGMADDPRIGALDGVAGADRPTEQRWYTPELAEDEKYIKTMWKEQGFHESPDRETRRRMRDLFASYSAESDHPLSRDQEHACAAMLTGGGFIRGMVGPAGSGKTTTMRAMIHVIDQIHGPGKVVGACESARAASELQQSLGIHTNTIDKLLDELRTGREHARWERITQRLKDPKLTDPRERRSLRAQAAEQAMLVRSLTIPEHGFLIIDEASMVSTRHAAALMKACRERHTDIMPIGDPRQLDAVGEGGGWFAYGDEHGRLPHLDSIFRFLTKDEQGHTITDREMADLSLKIRDCRTPEQIDEVLDGLQAKGLIHPATETDLCRTAIDEMRADLEAGRSHIIIASNNQLVDQINREFTDDRQARGLVDPDPAHRIPLRDGNTCGAGDLVATRENDRRLSTSDGTWVRNNDQWTVIQVGRETTLLERTDGSKGRASIPNSWLERNAQLGYAITTHRSQGATVDRCSHIEAAGSNTLRAHLYVSVTRGRWGNDLYVQIPDINDGRLGTELLAWRAAKRQELENRGLRLWEGPGAMPQDGRWYTTSMLDPTPMDLARRQLREVLARDSEAKMATEQRKAARSEAWDPARIEAEHRRFTVMLHQPELERILNEHHDPLYVEELKTSNMWDALCDAWARARTLDPATAERVVMQRVREDAAMKTPADDAMLFDMPVARDKTAILVERLRDQILKPGNDLTRAWKYGLTPLDRNLAANDPNMASMIRQASQLIDKTSRNIARQAAGGRIPWAMELRRPGHMDSDKIRNEYRELVTQIHAWRRQYDIDAPQPLGPAPIGGEGSERNLRRTTLAVMINRWNNGQSIHDDTTPMPETHAEATSSAEPEPQSTASDPYVEYRPDGWSPADWTPMAVDMEKVNRIAETNRIVWEYWQSQADNGWAGEYAKTRGMNPDQVGQAPAGRDTTLHWATAKARLGIDELKEAGLVRQDQHGRWIDVFRDRMCIPIVDEQDRIIAFTGRINPEHQTEHTPKYINTTNTEAYVKADQFLGLDRAACQRIRQGAGIIICEGAMDREALERAANTLNTVDPSQEWVAAAPCGTSLTERQLAKTRALAGGEILKPMLCFDNDQAGRKATLRAWAMLTERERANATILTLPEQAKDAGDLMKEHKLTDLAAQIATARPLWQQMTDTIIDQTDLAYIVGQNAAAENVNRAVADLMPEGSRTQVDEYARQRIASEAERIGAEDNIFAIADAGEAQAAMQSPSPRPMPRTSTPGAGI